jgi:hypothetical protein
MHGCLILCANLVCCYQLFVFVFPCASVQWSPLALILCSVLSVFKIFSCNYILAYLWYDILIHNTRIYTQGIVLPPFQIISCFSFSKYIVFNMYLDIIYI